MSSDDAGLAVAQFKDIEVEERESLLGLRVLVTLVRSDGVFLDEELVEDNKKLLEVS
jgi:hypothetical protein